MHSLVISLSIFFLSLYYEKDINIKGKEDQAPIHLAAKYNAIDGLRELIANKADINARNQFGLTPLHFTSRRNFEQATKVILLNFVKIIV